MRLHPEGPPGSASIQASPPRPTPPAPGHPPPHTSAWRPGSPALALGSHTEPAISSSRRQFRLDQGPRSRDPLSQAPAARTHPISHGPVTFRSLNTGPVRKQTAQLVTTENSSVRRRLLLLLPAILPVSGGNAGSWQPPPPPPPGLHLSGPALPVVASPGAVETVMPPENYNPRDVLRAVVSFLPQRWRT